MVRDPFLQKSLLGGDPLEGYPPCGMRVEDVACDDDVLEKMSWDTRHDREGIHMKDVHAGGGEEQPLQVLQPLLAPLTILPIFNSNKGYESLTLRIPPC